jgi:hypothetical protein
MPAPFTVVVLADEDGDEFPVRLAGVYRENRGADIKAALQLLRADRRKDLQKPNGVLSVARIEYVGDEVAATQEP